MTAALMSVTVGVLGAASRSDAAPSVGSSTPAGSSAAAATSPKGADGWLAVRAASGGVASGFKAGSLPGGLTVGMEQRVVGTKRYATGALLIGGLDEATASSTDFGWQELLVEAMSYPTYARRVIATLGGMSSGTPGSTPTGPLVQTDLVR